LLQSSRACTKATSVITVLVLPDNEDMYSAAGHVEWKTFQHEMIGYSMLRSPTVENWKCQFNHKFAEEELLSTNLDVARFNFFFCLFILNSSVFRILFPFLMKI
jgi:hypothetical protein